MYISVELATALGDWYADLGPDRDAERNLSRLNAEPPELRPKPVSNYRRVFPTTALSWDRRVGDASAKAAVQFGHTGALAWMPEPRGNWSRPHDVHLINRSATNRRQLP